MSDDHGHKSTVQKTSSMRSEVVEARNSAGGAGMLANYKLMESLDRSQKQLIETLTTSYNKGLIEALLAHQSKSLVATSDEKKPRSDDYDDDKKQNSAEYTGPYVPKKYEELFSAAYYGNWEKAKRFLEKYPEAKTEAITNELETAVHIAAHLKEWEFVVRIVDFLPKEALASKEKYHGYTALHIAAFAGKCEAAKAMVRKNRELINIRDNEGNLPLETAMLKHSTEQNNTVEYLFSVTKRYYPSLFSGANGVRLLCNTIEANLYDFALSIVEEFPTLVMEKIEKKEMYIFELMACRPFAFRSGTRLSWRQHFVYSLIRVNNKEKSTISDEENPMESSEGPMGAIETPLGSSDSDEGVMKKFISCFIMRFHARVPLVRNLYDQKLMHKQARNLVIRMLNKLDRQTETKSEVIDFLRETGVVNMAIKYGITEFVVECLKVFPFVVSHDLGGKTMLQMAITERNEDILNQILDFTSLDDTNNILHYAAILAPPHQLNSVSGPALQMQREVQWFKGVRRMVHPFLRHTRNADGLTAEYVFTEQHKGLRKTGEKWLKDTSGSCMVVATLIATVAFAAAFTVPGGNNQETGYPIFLKESDFIMFVAADAVALFSSITSVLLFLAIMTSRYAEKDFLKSLPQKLIIGLAMLFISMASILVAFCASFILILDSDKYNHFWVAITISCLGVVPVLSFFYLQSPLFLEMVRVTFWPSILKIKNRRHLLSEKEIRRPFRQRSLWRIFTKQRD